MEVFDFDGGFEEEDRDGILNEAADYLDRNAVMLSGSGPDETDKIGDLIRAFSEDQASLGRPQIYPVTRAAIEQASASLPVATRDLTRRARFYVVAFPVSLFSAVGRGFNRLEVKVAFNHNQHGLRPTTFDILPDRQWATTLGVDADLSIGVTADLKFTAGLPEVLSAVAGLPVSGSAGANAGAHAKLLIGPFSWAIRCPEIEHSAPDLDHVFWRLSGTRFVREQDPGLRVMLRVPNEIDRLEILGQMQVRRYYNLFEAKLVEAIKMLPDAMISFFSEKGTRVRSQAEWDLSQELDDS